MSLKVGFQIQMSSINLIKKTFRLYLLFIEKNYKINNGTNGFSCKKEY